LFKIAVLFGKGRAHTFALQILEVLLKLKKVSCTLEWRGARTAKFWVFSHLLRLGMLPLLWQRWQSPWRATLGLYGEGY